jgi:hypothetical protein
MSCESILDGVCTPSKKRKTIFPDDDEMMLADDNQQYTEIVNITKRAKPVVKNFR